ncbi:MAG TPA: hypothetical protein VG962_01925 [Steroidobacteraceae bacterium]|nr:hypothetical protein [Steroidobacteraceae bacterium]
MIPGRANSAVGKTRICPHCKATILESAAICPACQHHLQFNRGEQHTRQLVSETALRVEGTIKHPGNEPPWEYSLVISVRNERGVETHRHIVAVGAVQPDEQRTVTLSLEVFKAITADSGSK